MALYPMGNRHQTAARPCLPGVASSPTYSEDPANDRSSQAIGLAILLAGIFMAALDASIVNVAAPQIQEGLQISGSSLVLALSGYALAYAMLLITGARLGDDYGHRRLFVGGLTGFTLASLSCGLAPTGEALIASRLIQGATAALMAPQVLSMIQLQHEGEQRVRALGLYATVLAGGVVGGQVIGGVIVNADLFGTGWRPVFLINVPIGAVLVAGAHLILEDTRGAVKRQMDLLGVALCSAAVLLVTLPLVFGYQEGWPAWIFGMFVAGIAVLAATWAHFVRLDRRGGDPLIHPETIRDPAVRFGLASLFASTVAWGGFLFTFTLFLQSGLGYSALRSGLTFVPYGVAFAIVSVGFRCLPAPIARRAPVAGLILMAASYGTLGVIDRSGWHAGASAVLMAAAGAGYAAGFSPLIAGTAARVPLARAYDVSGVVNTTIQIAFMLGIASLGSYFLDQTHRGDAAANGVAFSRVGIGLAAASLIAAGLAAAIGHARRASEEVAATRTPAGRRGVRDPIAPAALKPSTPPGSAASRP